MNDNIYTVLKECRICKNPDLNDVIDLGEQIITSRFPLLGDYSTPSTKIVLCMCSKCGLLQLRHTTESKELYEAEYGYRSGITNLMRNHLKQYQEEMLEHFQGELIEGDIVLDIGSNDSTTLQYYDKKYERVGMDPTGNQFKEYYNDVNLIPTYFTASNFKKVYGKRKCKIVSSISMFYDLPDPVQFAKDVYEILDEDGIWTSEQSYLVTMLKQNSFDTICHEHLEYYGLRQLKTIADMSNFKIIDIKMNHCNGGSARIYFAKKDSPKYTECTELLNEILNHEIQYGIMEVGTYKDFMKRCDNEMQKLTRFIDMVNSNNKRVYVYGASTKGNCFLQYGQIDSNRIKYAVERNPNKIGKMTVTGIEIISEETMRNDPPEYLLVLPWHFREEIVEREKAYLENGGQIIFALPTLEIVSSRKKVLVTGSNGMIASYFLELNKDKYNYYGISRTPSKEGVAGETMCFPATDLTNTPEIENIILTIKPDIIVHLAGISSSIYAYHNPVETIQTNGMVIVNICDIIFKNKLNTRVFNASSSDMYKGHEQRFIHHNDQYFNHCHPYSIAKIMGHSIVDFYRNTHKLPFSNGVIFTSESPRKKGNFLLNKVVNHAKKWALTPKNTETLELLGGLKSYRNYIHSYDVATAIHKIIEQPEGDNYNICGLESIELLDMVINVYHYCGVKLYVKENALYEEETNKMVVNMGNISNETDKDVVININGEPTNLLKIGWKPRYNIQQMLSDIADNTNN
jgi:nucleoside-diphosphate-sugar epimerase